MIWGRSEISRLPSKKCFAFASAPIDFRSIWSWWHLNRKRSWLMSGNLDTRNLDTLAGAVYFTVGRGTEGGSASYRLSVAGVEKSEWGKVDAVAANSGYSMGTIQVD